MTKTREIQRAELSQTFNLNIFENKKDWTISLTLSYSSNFDFSHQLLKAFQNCTFSCVFHRKNPRLWNWYADSGRRHIEKWWVPARQRFVRVISGHPTRQAHVNFVPYKTGSHWDRSCVRDKQETNSVIACRMPRLLTHEALPPLTRHF